MSQDSKILGRCSLADPIDVVKVEGVDPAAKMSHLTPGSTIYVDSDGYVQDERIIRVPDTKHVQRMIDTAISLVTGAKTPTFQYNDEIIRADENALGNYNLTPIITALISQLGGVVEELRERVEALQGLEARVIAIENLGARVEELERKLADESDEVGDTPAESNHES